MAESLEDPGLAFLRVWNIFAAGIPGCIALFFPASASKLLYKGKQRPSDASRMLGAYWLTVSIMSAVLGGSRSVMCTMGLVQLLYKSIYLTTVMLPKMVRGETVSYGEFCLFLFNVTLLLPLTLPWSHMASILFASDGL